MNIQFIISFLFLNSIVCFSQTNSDFIFYNDSSQQIANCNLANTVIENIISEKAAELHGTEHCQFRRYSTLNDIDKDGINDFIVVFSVDGVYKSASLYMDFMLVFLSSNNKTSPLEIEVGGRGDASFSEIYDVSENKLALEMKVWREEDGLCCPSGRRIDTYEILKDKIQKIK